VEQQQELRSRNYRYQPRDVVVRKHYQEQAPRREQDRDRSGQRGR